MTITHTPAPAQPVTTCPPSDVHDMIVPGSTRMPDPTPDPLAAYLAEVRARYTNVNYSIATESPRMLQAAVDSTSDTLRLLAALDAVLAKAAEWDEIAATLDGHSDRAEKASQTRRSEWLSGRAQGHEDSAKALREAISRALLGEVPTGA